MLEVVVGVSFSVILNFLYSYFFLIRRQDKLEYEIETIKKEISKIHSLKLEEILTKFEYQLSTHGDILNEIKFDLKDIKKGE